MITNCGTREWAELMNDVIELAGASAAGAAGANVTRRS